MRSINTSLIGLLPVAGLLFIGAGVLGVGTLEDLALVLFVGMITGAYSSLFLATPWLVDFKMLDTRYRNHANRVLAKRAADTKSAAGKAPAAGRLKASTPAVSTDDLEDEELEDTPATRVDALATTATTPRVGAKPPAKRAAANRPGGARASKSTGKRRH
jgi:preprotein translocase subunit SecF